MNPLLNLPKGQMAALRFEDVQQYLQSRHWQYDEHSSSDGIGVYRLPNEPAAEILLPLRRDWGDYAQRMADIVGTLAAIEQRSIWEMLNDLSAPAGDVVRLRVIAPNTTLGTLPLEDGLRLLQGGRDMLRAAACSAHQAQAYYPRQSFREALEFLESCRLGQTERGSFVATIIAPVPVEIEPSLFPKDQEEDIQIASEPYPRRVMLQLMSALRTLQQSLQEGKPDRILHGVQAGVSANLCDALAEMTPSSEQASLEICTTWSRARPSVPASLPKQVGFAHGELAIIREAGRRLREAVPPRRQKIDGFIISLHAEKNLFDDGFEGRIIMRSEVAGRSARVRVTLVQVDYTRACDAHRDGLRVAVAGVLQRDAHSKLFDLLHPQQFKVLS